MKGNIGETVAKNGYQQAASLKAHPTANYARQWSVLISAWCFLSWWLIECGFCAVQALGSKVRDGTNSIMMWINSVLKAHGRRSAVKSPAIPRKDQSEEYRRAV